MFSNFQEFLVWSENGVQKFQRFGIFSVLKFKMAKIKAIFAKKMI
jgi:hypothetical protein